MKANQIYRGLIGECERIEHEGIYKGNGHHLAQRLTNLVLIELLPKKQRNIYDCLTESYVTAKELADLAKVETKEISPNIKQINSKGTLVITTKDGHVIKYKRA